MKLINITDKKRNQRDWIAFWNAQKKPMMSMQDLPNIKDKEDIDGLRSNFRWLWVWTSTQILYNKNNLGATIIHNAGSKVIKETRIKVREIPDYTAEPIQNALETPEGLSYLRALLNKRRWSAEQIIAELERVSGKNAESIRLYTPSESSRKDQPLRAVGLFFYDLVGFSVGGSWIDGDEGFARGVKAAAGSQAKAKGKIISFKSTPENFKKERSGRKPCTIRFTDDWTKARWKQYHEANHVEIVCLGTSNHKILRPISDKSNWKNVVCISWRHPQ